MDTENPSIETALSDAIALGRNSRPAGPREAFYISSMGMCPRKQIAERAGLPPTHPPDNRSYFKMWTGQVLGTQMAKLLEAVGYLDPTWTEQRVTYRSYHGRPDGVTRTIEGGAIVEVKTADDRAVMRDDWPEHYLWQAMTYALAADFPHVVLFMVGKNQGNMKHRVVAVDDGWRVAINQEIDRMEGLWELFTLHHVLPSHEHRFAWEDKWCSMLEDGTATTKEDV